VPDGHGREAVLLSGLYGVGKSSMAAELADLLERAGIGYALLDLDFLAWFDTGSEDGPGEEEVFRANLTAVMRNYVDAGIGRFVLAGLVADAAGRERLADDLGMPLRVVRLTVPFQEIERRLKADVTTGRADDLREARAQLQRDDGVGIEDLTVANDRPIRVVASEIVAWLGWLDAAT
jgi:predicted kinase